MFFEVLDIVFKINIVNTICLAYTIEKSVA